jgi:hypothetical protein
LRLAKKAKLEHGKLNAGRVFCAGACGRIVAVLRPKQGKGVIAREAATVRTAKRGLVLKPTEFGKRLLARSPFVEAKLITTVTQPDRLSTRMRSPLRVVR